MTTQPSQQYLTVTFLSILWQYVGLQWKHRARCCGSGAILRWKAVISVMTDWSGLFHEGLSIIDVGLYLAFIHSFFGLIHFYFREWESGTSGIRKLIRPIWCTICWTKLLPHTIYCNMTILYRFTQHCRILSKPVHEQRQEKISIFETRIAITVGNINMHKM